MAKIEQQDFVVFFSWQSDLPKETTTGLIRECLRRAATQLEKDYAAEGLHVVIDEATRGKAGSPNIPQTIMDKIADADAFLCDMTTINAERGEGQRAVPNPNVGIELGYAIGHLGWERIIMLFNTAHGTFPDDMPFDVDRHRASQFVFSLPLPDDDKLTKKQRAELLEAMKAPLCQLLFEALAAVWSQKPTRPADLVELPPQQRKRQRDTATLREMFSTIHLPTVDNFLEEIQIGHIPEQTFHFWESFNGLFNSRLFHLYDDTARDLVKQIHGTWEGTFEFNRHFRPNAGHSKFIFGNPGDMPLDDEQQKDWDEMQGRAGKMRDALDALIAHVRAEYVEIDLEQTSANAWREFIRFQEDYKRRAES